MMRAAPGLALVVACAACSSSSSSSSGSLPPVIDSVDAADTVKAGEALQVTVKGHDEDDNVVTLKVHLVANVATQDPPAQSLPSPSKQVGVVLALVFSAGAPSGTAVEYDVTLIDQAGHESAPFKKNVTIQ
jgi:hypothetical protein